MSKNTKPATKSTPATTSFADTLAALRKEQKTLLATFVADRQKLYDDYRLAKSRRLPARPLGRLRRRRPRRRLPPRRLLPRRR